MKNVESGLTKGKSQMKERLLCAASAVILVLLINYSVEGLETVSRIWSQLEQSISVTFAEMKLFLTSASWKPWFLMLGVFIFYTACRWIKGAMVGKRLGVLLFILLLSVFFLWKFAGHNLDGRVLFFETGVGVLCFLAIAWAKKLPRTDIEKENDKLREDRIFIGGSFWVITAILTLFSATLWNGERDLYPEASAIMTEKYGKEFQDMKLESVEPEPDDTKIAFAEKTMSTAEQSVCIPKHLTIQEKMLSTYGDRSYRCAVKIVVRGGVIKIVAPKIVDNVSRSEATEAVLAVAEGFVDKIRNSRKNLDAEIAAQSTWR